jgi:hypothetical protein
VIVASRNARVFEPHALHPLQSAPGAPGELRLNPLYAAEVNDERVRLRLEFPSPHYADEFAACLEYLPATVELPRAALDALAAGRLPPELEDLARRRVILDLPKRYC